MPEDRNDLPSTLERSPEKAQRTYEKALESAEKTYGGDEARAHRVAWAAVKHTFHKEGDHWARGPAQEGATRGAPAKQDDDRDDGRRARGRREKHDRADGPTKQELYDKAKALGISGRSSMSKDELARAVERESR